MKNLSLRLAALTAFAALTVLLAGCAGGWGIRRSPSDTDIQSIHHLGVGSSLGHDFHMFHQGYTVFGNTRSTAIVDWNIDAFMVETSLSMLTANPATGAAPFDVSRLPSQAKALYEDDAFWTAARRQGFDHLLLFMPGVSQNMQLFTPGVGFYEMGMFGGWRCAYAGYTASVYNVATREVIGWQWAIEQPCKPHSSDDISFRDQFDMYSSQDKDKIRERLNDRLVESLDFVLKKLDLVSEPKK